MTKLQGWIVVGLLAFLCAHVLAADVIGIKVLTETSSPSAPATDTRVPQCDPEGDVCP